MLSAIQKSAEEFIRMPVFDELDVLESHMRLVSGFPGAVLAVDGTLVEIERPADSEGWYCRKELRVNRMIYYQSSHFIPQWREVLFLFELIW